MRTVTVNFVVLLSFYQLFIVFVEISRGLYNLKRYSGVGLQTLNISFERFDVYMDAIYYSFIIAQVLSAIYVISMMVLIYISQREHLIQAWRGNKSFIPKKCLDMESGEMMAI